LLCIQLLIELDSCDSQSTHLVVPYRRCHSSTATLVHIIRTHNPSLFFLNHISSNELETTRFDFVQYLILSPLQH